MLDLYRLLWKNNLCKLYNSNKRKGGGAVWKKCLPHGKAYRTARNLSSGQNRNLWWVSWCVTRLNIMGNMVHGKIMFILMVRREEIDEEKFFTFAMCGDID